MSKYLNKKGLTNLVSKIKSFIDQKLKDLDIDTGLYAKQSDMEAVQAVIPTDASANNKLLTSTVTYITSASSSFLPSDIVSGLSIGPYVTRGYKLGPIVQLVIVGWETTTTLNKSTALCRLPRDIPFPKDTIYFTVQGYDPSSYAAVDETYLLMLDRDTFTTRSKIPANRSLKFSITYLS